MDYLRRLYEQEPKTSGWILLLGVVILVLDAVFIYTAARAEVEVDRPFRISEHFIANEFRCKCCGELRIDMELIIKLEELRALVGRPIIVLSGYRCPEHNKEVGGADNSQHLYGKAADIKVQGVGMHELARKARQAGFSFVKLYSGWVHVDVR